MRIRCGVLSVSLVLMAFGGGGCGRTSLVPRHDGGVSRGDAAAPDRTLLPPDTALASKPDLAIDQAIRAPDSSPDRSVETSPDRPFDTLPDLPRDLGIERSPDLARDTAVDRIPDLALDRGREVGDTAADRVPDGPSSDRVPDSVLLVPDAVVDTVARELGGDLDAGDAGFEVPPPGLSVLAGTLAGPGGLDGIGPSAQFYFPSGLASDGAGNLYIADSANNTIRKMVLATREVTTVAGLMGVYGSDDGVGASARFYSPQGLAVDGGSLYIADCENHTVRKMVLSSGKVTTIVGTAGQEGHVDARGSEARFACPLGLAVDGVGNLFVSSSDHTIRQVVLSTSDVTTVAGEPMVPGDDDGRGQAAHFGNPKGLAADDSGNLYVADSENCTLRKIALATGTVTTLAGSPGSRGVKEGVGSAARFESPQGLALDGTGNLYVTDRLARLVRKVVLATAAVSSLPDSSKWQSVESLAYDGAGDLYVTDSVNHTVARVALATGMAEVVAGRATIQGGQDGVGAEASFFEPTSLVSDGKGAVFIADSNGGHMIRKIDAASGRVTTLADAPFTKPRALAYDSHGILYVAELDSGIIRKMEIETGVVTTLAGHEWSDGSVDGKGTMASFLGPSGLALDGAGNLFVAEAGGHVIRKIALADATVTTLAGAACSSGTSDGIGAQARFNGPSGLACDGAGHLYVADTGSCTIRLIDVASGLTTTLAGVSFECEGRDGIGTAARFQEPRALVMDAAGRLLVADSQNDTVRRIDLATKQVTTIVGHSGRWQTVPGPLPAYVARPTGLAVLPSGDLVISDVEANVILLAHF